MNFDKKFIQFVNSNHLFKTSDKLLVAVSGGIDSVVLVHLLHQLGYTFSIAHCNFQLRGADSVNDENFVQQLAESLHIPLHTIRFNTKEFCEQEGVATQEGARKLRYTWFENLAKNEGFDYILTAHHANDNIETVVMNFFRGTGMNGLTGINPKNGKIVRPLLFALKHEIIQYQIHHSLAFVHDISNDSTDYTRNYIRHEILPQMQKVYPQVQNNILNNIERWNDSFLIYQKEITAQLKKWKEIKGDEIWISVLKIKKTIGYKTILHEFIQAYHFTAHQLDEVVKLLDAPSGKFIVSPTHRILKNRNHIIISMLQNTEKTFVVIDSPGIFDFQEGVLKIKETQTSAIISDSNIACINADLIEYPIILRPWKMGDYFYPLGMEKKKKLSRFLIDQKLSQIDKEKVWVLESNKKIIWIVGYRIDNRFKVKNNIQKQLNISFLSHANSL